MASESTTGPVTVSVVLRREARDAKTADRVRQTGVEMGMTPVSSGAATVTFRVGRERFEEIFGSRPEAVEAVAPGGRDFGAPAGFAVEEELPVPEAMAEHVMAVSVEPPARRLEGMSPGKESQHGEEEGGEEEGGGQEERGEEG